MAGAGFSRLPGLPALAVRTDSGLEHCLGRWWRGMGKLYRQASTDLKMLIVGRIAPVASPNRKAVLGKHVQDLFGHSWLARAPDEKFFSFRRADLLPGVFPLAKRILYGIDVDRQSVGMK